MLAQVNPVVGAPARRFGWRWLPLSVCLLWVLAPNICWFVLNVGSEGNEPSLRALQGAFGFLLILLSLLRRWPRLTGLTAGICAIPAVAVLWYVRSFTVPLDINVLSLVGETGSAEARDLLSSVPVWVWLGMLLACVAMLCSVVWPWQAPSRWPSRAVGALGLGIVLVMSLMLLEPDDRAPGSLPLDAAPSVARAAFVGSYPMGLPVLLHDYRVSRQVVASAMQRKQDHVFGAARLTADQHGRRIHVFVIGETGRGSRWQLNGYSRPTNPYLSKRSDVISFSQMTTPFVFTRLSVPAMLTRAGTRDVSRFNEGSVVAAFKEAGYRTAWISMQAPLGFHESMVSSYAGEADQVRFLNPVDYSAHGVPDMKGVDAVMEYIGQQPADADLFIVLHTLGSHFRYTDRYPTEEAYFLPDNAPDRRVGLYSREDAVYLSNAYDNSLRYTDKVLNTLFDRLAALRTQSWVYYSADHGEALFDGCDGTAGHGQFNAQTQSVAAAFWASPEYAAAHPAKVDVLRRRKEAPLSTLMVFETLTALGDVGMPGQRAGYDFSAGDGVLAPPALRHAACEVATQQGR